MEHQRGLVCQALAVMIAHVPTVCRPSMSRACVSVRACTFAISPADFQFVLVKIPSPLPFLVSSWPSAVRVVASVADDNVLQIWQMVSSSLISRVPRFLHLSLFRYCVHMTMRLSRLRTYATTRIPNKPKRMPNEPCSRLRLVFQFRIRTRSIINM